MSKLTAITSTLVLTFSMSSFADGGNQWEERVLKVSSPHLHHGAPAASEMNHTAVQHKRWLFDDADNSPLNDDASHPPVAIQAHMNHMGSDHKRMSVGSN
ncbi:hypothetical protein [Alkalimarinus alittae]|uniref:Uncharacterized protein n=1 Tax=Alkalimarinus alittae TaxID=2961619 RepID=A0ABY6MXB9_9ALTE|nr:hypothetical protein [Alkalimarinus alittae]UZE94488.1 hypothetical protein NKI27_10325 [Alkalimarinus alittae]